MELPDAATLAEHIQNLGLVTEAQLQEAWEELGEGTTDPEALLRVLERKSYLTSWQRQKLLKGEKDSFFVGGYRLLYQVASGSFGRVYRAADPATGQGMAVKVLRRRWCNDPRRVELFE